MAGNTNRIGIDPYSIAQDQAVGIGERFTQWRTARGQLRVIMTVTALTGASSIASGDFKYRCAEISFSYGGCVGSMQLHW